MPWYRFSRGGWQIAVDAINQHDARQYLNRFAPAAKYEGEMLSLPTMANPSPATAMTTDRRQEQISAAIRQG